MIASAVATAIRQNMEDLMQQFDYKLDSLGSAFGQASGTIGAWAAGQLRQPTATFQLQARGGILSWLPDNFHFPHSSSYNCCTQWNIGNLERSILPLRSLVSKEFQVLDIIPKEANEWHGHTGKHKTNQRPAAKKYSEVKFFFTSLEKAAEQQGLDPSNCLPQNVWRMFEASENEIQNACGKNKQMDQLKWWTIVKKLRRQIKANLARELAQKHELATNPETSSDESDQEGYV
jgi:hypothetical protein